MEIKSGQTYLVNTGYKIYSSPRDDSIDKEKDGEPFEFVINFSTSDDNSISLPISFLTIAASLLSLSIFWNTYYT